MWAPCYFTLSFTIYKKGPSTVRLSEGREGGLEVRVEA